MSASDPQPPVSALKSGRSARPAGSMSPAHAPGYALLGSVFGVVVPTHPQERLSEWLSGQRSDRARRRCWISRYAAGMTNIDSNGAVIMPPTIGAAIRRMTSDPVPLPHMIDSSARDKQAEIAPLMCDSEHTASRISRMSWGERKFYRSHSDREFASS